MHRISISSSRSVFIDSIDTKPICNRIVTVSSDNPLLCANDRISPSGFRGSVVVVWVGGCCAGGSDAGGLVHIIDGAMTDAIRSM